MLNWYVAKTKPQKERFLTTFLAQWDVETFLPEIVRPTARTGGNDLLFPTYLFCQMDSQSPKWPIVRWAPGLSYFLSTDGQPTGVPDSLIEYLQERVQRWNGGEFHHRWTAGERVPVIRGPFAGLEGIFQSYIPARRRGQILLEVVGRLALVEIPEWDLGTATVAV